MYVFVLYMLLHILYSYVRSRYFYIILSVAGLSLNRAHRSHDNGDHRNNGQYKV